MNEFMIMIAPPLVVVASIAIVFYLAGRRGKPMEEE